MQADSISSHPIPTIEFVSNKDFQSKGLLYEGDSGFLSHRSRLKSKNVNFHANHETLSTLLATHGDNNSDNAKKLIAENICYRDLGSLNHKDLMLIGFTESKQRDELLSFFAQLPNQDPSLNKIYHLKEASKFNLKIINNASNHLDSMNSAFVAANYKLQIMPPEDVVLNEKTFASRFVLEALKELYGAAGDIEKEISELETTMFNKLQSNKNSLKRVSKTSVENNSYFSPSLVLCSLSSVAVLLALYIWKYYK